MLDAALFDVDARPPLKPDPPLCDDPLRDEPPLLERVNAGMFSKGDLATTKREGLPSPSAR